MYAVERQECALYKYVLYCSRQTTAVQRSFTVVAAAAAAAAVAAAAAAAHISKVCM